jgi:RNAse (barnase) inhibitor barstar
VHPDDRVSRLAFGGLAPEDMRLNSSLVARVPASIRTEGQLLDLLADELRFPSYFGRNWVALFDCLCDLTWLSERRIVVAHEGIPRHMPQRTLATYVRILADAVEWWARHPQTHELVSLFPDAAREPLSHLLRI